MTTSLFAIHCNFLLILVWHARKAPFVESRCRLIGAIYQFLSVVFDIFTSITTWLLKFLVCISTNLLLNLIIMWGRHLLKVLVKANCSCGDNDYLYLQLSVLSFIHSFSLRKRQKLRKCLYSHIDQGLWPQVTISWWFPPHIGHIKGRVH